MQHWTDRIILGFDRGLRAMLGVAHPLRVSPGADQETVLADESAARAAGALMRVNHVGEVCAQALYQGQALFARRPEVESHLRRAADEEADHLAWTRGRMAQLSARPSLLNPLWYAGAFVIGAASGAAGDATSLGFVVETERQVEEHLAGHLDRLPAEDVASRAIVSVMRDDERRHGQEALRLGAATVPWPARLAMRAAARVMTRTAYWI